MTREESRNLGFPKLVLENDKLSEDGEAVSLIINKLTDILTEQFGFDVRKELLKRINETETID